MPHQSLIDGALVEGDDSVIGRAVRLTRTVTANRPTCEWTGTTELIGVVSEGALVAVETGEIRGIGISGSFTRTNRHACKGCQRVHTWERERTIGHINSYWDIGTRVYPDRTWVTEISFLD